MTRVIGRWSMAVGLLIAALAVACASAGDSDDDDSGGDDDYDPNQGPESSSDNDDDDDDDDAGDDDDNDTSAVDDDADDEMSCAEVWLECEYDNPPDGYYDDDCEPYPDSGDPQFLEKLADRNACTNTIEAHRFGDLHDCGVTAGCDDWKAEYYACMEEYYLDSADCYATHGENYSECLPRYSDYQCGNL